MSVRLVRRLLVLVLATGGALVPMTLQPASADPLFPTATTAIATNPTPVVGDGFKIVGQVFLLLGDSPAPLPNSPVVLERRVSDSDPWTTVAQTTTAETQWGDEKLVMYTFNRVADRTASYRVRFTGLSDSDAIGVSASDDGDEDPLRIGVRRKMPISLKQPRPGAIYMAGSVTPGYAKQRVVVKRKTCQKCAWKVWARPITSSQGRYRVKLSAPRRGAHFFQARARASQGFSQSFSQIAKITSG